MWRVIHRAGLSAPVAAESNDEDAGGGGGGGTVTRTIFLPPLRCQSWRLSLSSHAHAKVDSVFGDTRRKGKRRPKLHHSSFFLASIQREQRNGG